MTTTKHAGGRPTDYRDEFAEQAEKLCALGATDMELADFFGVSYRTIQRWRVTNEAFCRAVKVGKEAADDRVESALYARALGYEYDSLELRKTGDTTEHVSVRKVVPPDTQAASLWLRNRRAGIWKDKVTQEHTGAGGGPIQFDQFSHLPPAEREEALRRAAREALLQLPVDDLRGALMREGNGNGNG